MKALVLNLTAGGLSGGYKKYLAELVPRLRRHSLVEELEVILPPTIHLSPAAPAERVLMWPAGSALVRRRWLRDIVRKHRPDVIFIPTARWMNLGDVPTVTMIRNMEPLTIPWAGNPWRERARNSARRLGAWYAARRSTHVIAVSHHVGDFLTNRWHLPAEKVSVIYHGVTPPAAVAPLRRPAGVPTADSRPFVFTAGSLRPARGLDDLIGAWSVAPHIARDYQLVIAGQVDPGMQDYVRGLTAAANAAQPPITVRWLGQLDQPSMAWCYSHCSAFVMTSRAEACPNTALEAMSYGAPCVSTDHPPMPEFFQSGALYYEARSAAALASVLTGLLTAPAAVRQQLGTAGIQRSRDFSWDETARHTAETLYAASHHRRSRLAAAVDDGDAHSGIVAL